MDEPPAVDWEYGGAYALAMRAAAHLWQEVGGDRDTFLEAAVFAWGEFNQEDSNG